MLRSLKKTFLQKHFKKTVAASSLTFGLVFAYAFTAFSMTAIALSVFLVFLPSYYMANRVRNKLDNKDIWKNILAAEQASYADAECNPEQEKVIALQWRAAYPAQAKERSLDSVPSEDRESSQESGKSRDIFRQSI